MELRLAFFIIGTISILGVLIHGIWKMRRQEEIPERDDNQRIEPLNTEESSLNDGFDELGVGNVRVISSANTEAYPDETESENDSIEIEDEIKTSVDDEAETQSLMGDVPSISDIDTVEDTEPAFIEKELEPPMYASVVTQPKPHMTSVATTKAEADDIPEPPEFLLKEEKSEPDFGLSATPAAPSTDVDSKTTAKKVVKHRAAPKRRQEPSLGKDQMNIDFDDSSPQLGESDNVTTSKQPEEVQSEVLAINVRAAEGESLSGAALLPLLLTLGFKFGEHDIFHRHVNANGKGPVLFSLANMVKPGVFDIDNLETFSTQGISLFMVLPIEGDPHQVFNMMHNAARKVADEFNGQLLDGRRSILTKQGIQQYVEKIREFERQRIISKSTI
ncbi:cell division protein ZipA [Alteromonas sp. 5E99-2]|uniref:cell division protein ZipA n=1 Tax=Alteromonas sp. 5E99-2 TaxID=2817683 RepID=UPI001A995CBC|nr:cell division protein ZipA [Alteromonas sp. 5E99-2]MBO1255605.1 cell division protein ZipA [Alteromonas sp. 5E99-2]